MSSLFVTFEGIEGCGKSTQVERLAKRLAQAGRDVATLREPGGLVAAITPFNHPLNQVAHKLAPAIAAGAPVLLKPSEKTPLTAVRFAELLFDAGLPGWMLSVLVLSLIHI